MYLKRLELKNTGPIEHLNLECQLNEDGSPKPVIFVGQNGSGKSVATAHVVSALIDAQGTVFDDSDVEKGKVYKLRHPSYVRYGATYSTGEVYFSDGFSVHEAQFTMEKHQYEDPFPEYSKWNIVQPTDTSHFTSNFHKRIDYLNVRLGSASHIYFPPNRFEEPAWLNSESLLNKIGYTSLKRFSNYSNRPIVNYAPMRALESWLLDLLYDCHALEKRTEVRLVGSLAQSVLVQEGPASTILEPINQFICMLLGKQGAVTWNIGQRNKRKIGVAIDNETLTNNLFQLSTGQAVLFDLFMTIIRDFDLSDTPLTQLSDIEGIVIVDEIDLHLHIDYQHNLLPKLIHLFPKIQFILTTHSPLFLTGMKKTFTDEGFQLIELPSGQEIEVERFSEFGEAYKHMQDSVCFQEEVQRRVKASLKPLLYLEGTTDFGYLRKAAELFDKIELIDRFEFVDSGGYPNMNKIWNAYSGHLNSSLRELGLLLYDCDTNKEQRSSGKMFQRTLPKLPHKISTGIENLFPDKTMEKAITYKVDFIDVTNAHQKTERGQTVTVSEKWEVNKDEKSNLCDWLCQNGTKIDFANFSLVFEILEEVLTNDPDKSK